MLIFLEGAIPSVNRAIIYELHGHGPYFSRQPNPQSGEVGMTIVEDGEVVARGEIEVYDFAHARHRLHVRNKLRAQDGLKPLKLRKQESAVLA